MTLFKRGLVLGKFMPVHQGHQALIEFAESLCRNVEIHITYDREADKVPLSERHQALLDIVRPSTFIYPFEDVKYKNTKKDKDGTVLDKDYWDWYMEMLDKISKSWSFDVIISSDVYGKEIARRLNIRWIPYDPTRELTGELSATKIRQNPREMYAQMVPYMRGQYGFPIVIMGPESAGKTTLAKHLSEFINGNFVPEYGRTIDVYKDSLDAVDFDVIGRAQQWLINRACRNELYYTVVDTEAFTTQLYSKYMLGKETKSLEHIAMMQRQLFKKYYILPPKLDFKDDGSRTMEDIKLREKVFEDVCQYCEYYKLNYHIVESTDLLQRTLEIFRSMNT